MAGPDASYVPSGRVDGGRFAGVGVFGIACCAALGALYQLAQQAMPLLWFCVLYTLGAALILAVLCGRLSEAAHLRGHGLALTIGALWGLAAVVGSFVVAYRSELRPSFAEYVRMRIEAGWLFSRGRVIDGHFVILVWLIEAALFIYASARGALPGVYRPFCETCKRFATPHFAYVFRVDASTLRLAGARGDLDAVLAAPSVERGARLARYEVHACPICQSVGWLDVRLESAGEQLGLGDDPGLPWWDELLAGCTGSLAALAGSPSRRSPEHPVRGAVLDRNRMDALRARSQDAGDGSGRVRQSRAP